MGLLRKYFNLRTCFLVLIFLVTCLNFFSMIRSYNLALFSNNQNKFSEPGYEFLDLKEILSNTAIIGFLTNKNMSSEKNDGQFLKAQYILVPTVLDLGNDNYNRVIIDATSLIAAFDIMQKMGAVPVYVNQYEKILAERKP